MRLSRQLHCYDWLEYLKSPGEQRELAVTSRKTSSYDWYEIIDLTIVFFVIVPLIGWQQSHVFPKLISILSLFKQFINSIFISVINVWLFFDSTLSYASNLYSEAVLQGCSPALKSLSQRDTPKIIWTTLICIILCVCVYIYIYIYILSSTDRLFRSIRTLQCG